MPFAFQPLPFEEAEALVRAKAPMLAGVYRRLLPELRARALTVAGIRHADALRKVRDALAGLPRGADWATVKDDVLAVISPDLVSAADPEDRARQRLEAERKAELLLRTHGFQAYQACAWRAMREVRRELPFWQYRTAGDDRVRKAHAALDGLILPADDPFWIDHFPPWDWGCRCQAIALTRARVEEIRAREAGWPPEKRHILEGARLRIFRDQRQLLLGPNNLVDVRSPAARAVSDEEKRLAWTWRPGDLRVPVWRLQERYAKHPDVWRAFRNFAERAEVDFADGRRSVWAWQFEEAMRAPRAEALSFARRRIERAIALDWDNGRVVGRVTGDDRAVPAGRLVEEARANGRKIVLIHGHPNGSPPSPLDAARTLQWMDAVVKTVVEVPRLRYTISAGRGTNRDAVAGSARMLEELHADIAAKRRPARDWDRERKRLIGNGVLFYERDAIES